MVSQSKTYVIFIQHSAAAEISLFHNNYYIPEVVCPLVSGSLFPYNFY